MNNPSKACPQRHIPKAQTFGRVMAEELFTLNLGPATPVRPSAMLLRLNDLAAICAACYALGLGQDSAPQLEGIPTGEATELPVETIYPGALQ